MQYDIHGTLKDALLGALADQTDVIVDIEYEVRVFAFDKSGDSTITTSGGCGFRTITKGGANETPGGDI